VDTGLRVGGKKSLYPEERKDKGKITGQDEEAVAELIQFKKDRMGGPLRASQEARAKGILHPGIW